MTDTITTRDLQPGDVLKFGEAIDIVTGIEPINTPVGGHQVAFIYRIRSLRFFPNRKKRLPEEALSFAGRDAEHERAITARVTL